jgi:hypothetical protein
MPTQSSHTTTHRSYGRRSERGSTIIEFAIVFPLVMLVILAVAEFGIGFKDWLSISHAAREGVRIGATAGNDTSADISVLDAVERSMVAGNMGDLASVTISNPDASGEHTTYVWNSSSTCHWSPCPDPSDPGYTVPNWDPIDRKISIPTERIEVTVVYRHEWATRLFTSGPTTWTKSVVMSIEPQVFS